MAEKYKFHSRPCSLFATRLDKLWTSSMMREMVTSTLTITLVYLKVCNLVQNVLKIRTTKKRLEATQEQSCYLNCKESNAKGRARILNYVYRENSEKAML